MDGCGDRRFILVVSFRPVAAAAPAAAPTELRHRCPWPWAAAAAAAAELSERTNKAESVMSRCISHNNIIFALGMLSGLAHFSPSVCSMYCTVLLVGVFPYFFLCLIKEESNFCLYGCRCAPCDPLQEIYTSRRGLCIQSPLENRQDAKVTRSLDFCPLISSLQLRLSLSSLIFAET